MSEKDKNIYYCVGCGTTHPKGNFYMSHNPSHANGRLFHCKNFIKNKIYRGGKVSLENFKKLLREFNVPFLIDLYETSKNSGSEIVGTYFRMINSLPQLVGLTWDDSVFELDVEPEDKKEELSVRKEVEEFSVEKAMTIAELEKKWGMGYNKEELYAFERKYLMLKDHYNEKTAMHTEALYNYIRYRVKEELATADGNVGEAKSWGALASKAATDAKINPSQLSKADLSDGLSTFSELSQAIEKEVDIIRILPRFKYRPNDALDFNIWCYINYERDLSGLPPAKYSDVYKFYDRKIEEYIEQYGDPYGIFEGDPTKENRENIEKFIEVGEN